MKSGNLKKLTNKVEKWGGHHKQQTPSIMTVIAKIQSHVRSGIKVNKIYLKLVSLLCPLHPPMGHGY